MSTKSSNKNGKGCIITIAIVELLTACFFIFGCLRYREDWNDGDRGSEITMSYICLCFALIAFISFISGIFIACNVCRDWQLLNKIFVQCHTFLTVISTFACIVAICSCIEYWLWDELHDDGFSFSLMVLIYGAIRLYSVRYIHGFINGE